MLTFFKKIRQQLLSENRFSRYLMYAIGEILLVMIGIILALQVNNWNEERKDTIEENHLLKELIINLNSNVNEFNQNINHQKRHIQNIDIILDHLENGKPYHDSLDFISLIYIEQISLSRSAYETFKSVGLNTIRSEALKMGIIKLFEMTYPKEINLIRDVSMQRYSTSRDIFNKYFRTNRELVALPVDYESLQHNQEFINWTYNRRAWKTGVINANKRLIEPTEELIENVSKYLSD